MLGCSHFRSPIWLKQFAPRPLAHARCALLLESLCVHRVFLWWSHTSSFALTTVEPCFFCRLRPLPAVTWLCGFDPQSLIHCSLASSGCFHKANHSSLSQTAEVTSKARVSMPTLPAPVSQAVESWVVLPVICATLSLLYPPLIGFCPFSDI